jgi:hypothetical protein
MVEFKVSSIRFPLLGKAGHGGRYGIRGGFFLRLY